MGVVINAGRGTWDEVAFHPGWSGYLIMITI